ncbi:hypothetical protein [Polaromonas sp.]|uniref:hypothetical protein n=1 Tax=Polaromonas sp. TaxID=1869339 RepID=UPI003264EBA8
MLTALLAIPARAETATASASMATLSIDADKTAVFGQPLQFILVIRNNAATGGSAITPLSIQVIPIGRLASAYDVLNISDDVAGLRAIPPGHTLQLRKQLKPTESELWQRYFHTTQAYDVMVDATWADNSQAATRQPVTMLSSPAAVICGGILGALLLTLFTRLYPLLRSQPKNIEETTAALIWSMFASSLMGAILAMLIIAITRATSSITLPVAIKVEDFVGGLMVGMFSHVLAPWLAEKLSVPGATLASAGPVNIAHHDAEDGCDAAISDATPDEELPAARGGVA